MDWLPAKRRHHPPETTSVLTNSIQSTTMLVQLQHQRRDGQLAFFAQREFNTPNTPQVHSPEFFQWLADTATKHPLDAKECLCWRVVAEDSPHFIIAVQHNDTSKERPPISTGKQ